jgi:hypothetical protein
MVGETVHDAFMGIPHEVVVNQNRNSVHASLMECGGEF